MALSSYELHAIKSDAGLAAAAPSYVHIYDLLLAAVLCLLAVRIERALGQLGPLLVVSAILAALVPQRASNLVPRWMEPRVRVAQ